MHGLRVFLSSTATDLGEYRRNADDTLLRLQQESVVMERFGPLPGMPVAVCERLAAESDLVICIVAHRYGYEPDPGRGSITRREVEAARKAGKPVYAWIVDAEFPWTLPKEQDRLTQPEVLADPAKLHELAAAVKALQDFKAWLRSESVVETFTTPDDLGRKIAVMIANTAITPATGRSSMPALTVPELRIVHALQPSPHFSGRDSLVDTLSAWVNDIASPDRIQVLVAAGGTGKTAIAERVVSLLQKRWPPPGTGSVLVWSFYEKPDSDAFVRECAQVFLGEADDAPAGGRLERLQRGLRDGRPHLIVLDGLERVQAEARAGRVRGELEDHTLKLLLQSVASELGRTRALVTSRYPLVDLRDWQRRGVVETALDDLSQTAARRVLRGWGVQGSDAQLDSVGAQVGRHALSVAVIGSYLAHFEGGRIEAAAALQLDTAVGDDPKAAKLARVLAYYAERLPVEERELLARLSVFPRGITLELLGTLVDAGGNIAGVLVNARPALPRLLARLLDRGLIFRYASTDDTLTWTAHPFVRERFAGLLGCPTEDVFDAIADRLGQGLERRPEQKPAETAMLDQYERLVEATRLAGRQKEAFDLYWYGLGYCENLARRLGDYNRGYRIMSGFLPASGDLTQFGENLSPLDQSLGLNDLGEMARVLGRLSEAREVRKVDDALKYALGNETHRLHGLLNTFEITSALGHLAEALDTARKAMELDSTLHSDDLLAKVWLSNLAIVQHRLGSIAEAKEHFLAAIALQEEAMLDGFIGQDCGRHHFDRGEISTSREIAEAGLDIALREGWAMEIPGWHALLGLAALAEGHDPKPHLDAIRGWTARTGDMQWIIQAHDLAARDLLVRGDLTGARAEVDDGLRQARQCGYGLLLIEMLVTLSAIDLAWPDAARALASAREALDLAVAPECRYAWGEADAAHAWGLAFEALGQREHAQRAFVQALEVRARIGHPKIEDTRTALARLA